MEAVEIRVLELTGADGGMFAGQHRVDYRGNVNSKCINSENFQLDRPVTIDVLVIPTGSSSYY